MSKTVLITGAAGALGRSVVARFAGPGRRIVALDRDREGLDRLEVGESRLVPVVADLTSSSEVASAFAELDADATPTIVHLAGGFHFAPLAECRDEDWKRLLEMNLESTFQVLRESSRAMARAGGGSVVAVSSPAVRTAPAGMGPYAAAKAGVLKLIEALAREVAPIGGRANAVLPGTMDTPANRAAMPDGDPATWVTTDEVADVIYYLSEASGVNGAAVDVPGPRPM